MLDKEKVRISERFRNHPIFNELICGTNFGFMAKRGYYTRPEVLKQPELMKKMGINWTTVNMNFCQKHYFSDHVFLDFEFSSGELELFEIIKRLHDNGIKVLFKPCLTPLDGAAMSMVGFPKKEMMSQIQGVNTDYWGAWFKSFTEAEKYFADLSERLGADAFLIGAEYSATEEQNEYWENVIAEVRNLYSGPITYEFNTHPNENPVITWMDKLDFLSHSCYPPACEVLPDHLITDEVIRNTPDYSVEQMARVLASHNKNYIAMSERFGNLPIAFTEYGVRSAHGCIMHPWDFLWDTPYDGKQQADYMQASFESYWDMPQWMGFFWWKWDETQYRPHYFGDPAGERGFTIQGKPAEDVMRRWAAKNR